MIRFSVIFTVLVLGIANLATAREQSVTCWQNGDKIIDLGSLTVGVSIQQQFSPNAETLAVTIRETIVLSSQVLPSDEFRIVSVNASTTCLLSGWSVNRYK